MSSYITLSLVWVGLCIAIGLYIAGVGMKTEQQLKLGFLAIGASYIMGLICLFLVIFFAKFFFPG